jgi:hypothetical protein
MKIVVNLDPATYERIKSLVAGGEYESVEQFLRVGADNQLAIEADADEAPVTTAEDASQQETLDSQSTAASTGDGYEWEYTVPDTVPTHDPHPADRDSLLLFSQYYRYLPLKFVILELAAETATVGGSVDLESFRDHIAEAVIPIRDALVEWEEAEDVSKQDRFSTGFPNRDASDPDRTMRRYLHHYVGRYKPEKGEPSGFGHDLGFVSIHADATNTSRIALTDAGRAFAELTNPVLSAGPSADTAALGTDECEFLVAYLRANLDLEYEFMEYVYSTLEHHEGTYTGAMDRFRSFLQGTEQFSDDPSDNQIRSHTAGTISRMVTVGALERGQRRGTYNTVRPLVSYRSDHVENHTEITQ